MAKKKTVKKLPEKEPESCKHDFKKSSHYGRIKCYKCGLEKDCDHPSDHIEIPDGCNYCDVCGAFTGEP